MGRLWWLVAALTTVSALAVALVLGCPPSDGAPEPSPEATPHAAVPRSSEPPGSEPPGSEPPGPSEAEIAEAVDRAAAATGVDLGLAVLDLATGALAGHNGDTPFRSASLSKLVVAVDVLGAGASDQDRHYLQRALSVSDDNAMNALWVLHDGIGAITRVAERAGLRNTTAPADPSQWGEVEMSAVDVVRLYQYVLRELPGEARDFIVSALSSAPTTAADGFDQGFGLLGLGGYTKQGWMYYLPADLYLHSAGVVGDRYAVALLSVQTGVATATARDNVTAIARTVVDALTDP
ncbi:serine hydrolase [Saccharothrix coeruleofusca]|uniref:Beta-lactamase class A catalytic domain-containing protein n=1 Tax=Saccharothrix coeruleofusca TaxID=33919 RepID=A0A918AIT7_9PSEU|nr:serine hydrolase [Saccharothrix coeruleofusca]GGP42159.1 hypothetical protein GCM10010185_11870 [Saccharothrix coeruleofusca]